MTDQITSIARMTALAEKSADEGYMNLSKLLEAAVYSQVRRTAWNYQPRVTKERLKIELETSIQYLRENDTPPGMLEAMETGVQNLAAQRGADLLLEDAPDVFVCRTCGEIMLEVSPQRCPSCGAWPGRFRKFVAVFNMDNQEPIDPQEVISLFARNAEQLASLVDGLSEDQLTQKPGADVWSIRDHVAHFYDAQEMLDTRLDLMLNHDDPELEALAIYEDATSDEGRPEDTQAMLLEFLEMRGQSIALLDDLPLEDLWRTGRHTEFGRITILRQVAYLAYHEQTHLPEIEALRQLANSSS